MDTLFFWASKLFWLLLSPGNILVLLTVSGLISLQRGSSSKAKWCLNVSGASMLLLTLLPVGDWLLYPLETRFTTNPQLPEQVDGIIVLAGPEKPYLSAVWQQVELGSSAERNYAFARMVHDYPKARYVFTGGSGRLTQSQYTCATVARDLFQQLRLDTDRIIFEDRSRNTHENIVNVKALVRPAAGETWILITSAAHMPRAVGIMRKQGWPVIPYPVDHQMDPTHLWRISLNFTGNLYRLHSAVREWTGLAAYYLTGKTPALLP